MKPLPPVTKNLHPGLMKGRDISPLPIIVSENRGDFSRSLETFVE